MASGDQRSLPLVYFLLAIIGERVGMQADHHRGLHQRVPERRRPLLGHPAYPLAPAGLPDNRERPDVGKRLVGVREPAEVDDLGHDRPCEEGAHPRDGQKPAPGIRDGGFYLLGGLPFVEGGLVPA